MVRSLAVLVLLCLSAQPACALTVNWQERMQRFSRYVGEQSLAQGRRTQGLERQSQNFQRRVQRYVRALEARARPFQAAPASAAAN